MPTTSKNKTESDYVPLSVTGITPDKSLGFDLYQRTEAGFRLFKHRTLQVSEKDIERLKFGDISTLYVPAGQRTKLFKHLRENLVTFLRDENTPASQKIEMLYETSATILANALETPESEDSLREVASQCDNHVMLALMNEECATGLRDMRAHDQPYHLSHAIMVGNLSILLALACGIDDPVELNVVGTGGLLHEIGLVALDKKYYLREGSKGITAQSRLQRYPEIGSQFLEKIVETRMSVMPVLHHRERLNGTGFPNRLRGREISRMGRIVAICDFFDERTNPAAPGLIETPFQALKSMTNGSGEFDVDIPQKFILMLGGVDSPIST